MNEEIMKRARIEMCFNLNKTLVEVTRLAAEAGAIPAGHELSWFAAQSELLVSMLNASGVEAYRGMERVITELGSDITKWRDENKMMIFKEMLAEAQE